jgi:CheY-like chemotaxis protein
MSKQKRALVVDDSKSARLVLRRMLEKHDILVETADSAAAALDYLSGQRPDVVFMDHMMPGMDGFEAVRAIKNNPQTATIPVMMYTSKGGDLYLGQARALGAVGVLPKTVAPAELYGTLKRLGLVQERRSESKPHDEDEASERAEDIEAPALSPSTFVEPGMRRPPAALDASDLNSHMRGLLDEQRVEIRKDVLVGMETVARQTAGKIARELDERFETLAGRQEPPSRSSTLPLIVLSILLFVSVAWNLLLNRRNQDMVLVDNNDEAQLAVAQQAENAVARLRTLQAETLGLLANSWKALGWAMNQSLQYPYDEVALDKQRVELIEQLLVRLGDTGYKGKVTLETHVGKFCLMGDQDTGFRLPPPELTVDQCEFIGNPVQPTDSPGAHQSLRFANFVNSTPLLEQDNFVLEIVTSSREEPLYAYPARSAETTAQAWNEVALRNNRVLVALEPQS